MFFDYTTVTPSFDTTIVLTSILNVLSFRLSLMFKKRHRLRTVLFLFHKKLPKLSFGDYGYGK